MGHEKYFFHGHLVMDGYAPCYDSSIVVHHHIRAERLTQPWQLHRYCWDGVSMGRFTRDSDRKFGFQKWKHLLSGFFRVALHPLRLIYDWFKFGTHTWFQWKYTFAYHVIKPHLVILGFYTGNDFLENLNPLDRLVQFDEYAILKHEVVLFGSDIKIRERSSRETMRFYKRAIGCPSMGPQDYNSIKAYLREELFYRTRLGTKVWELLHLMKQGIFKALINKARGTAELAYDYVVTKKYLSEIQDFLDDREIPFYVLLIPDRLESTKKLKKSLNYDRATRLLEQLAIPYLDIFGDLSIDDYVPVNARAPLLQQHTHWNQSGHDKAYQKIRDCFGNILEGEAIRFCLD